MLMAHSSWPSTERADWWCLLAIAITAAASRSFKSAKLHCPTRSYSIGIGQVGLSRPISERIRVRNDNRKASAGLGRHTVSIFGVDSALPPEASCHALDRRIDRSWQLIVNVTPLAFIEFDAQHQPVLFAAVHAARCTAHQGVVCYSEPPTIGLRQKVLRASSAVYLRSR
jgi:hypothetical protein